MRSNIARCALVIAAAALPAVVTAAPASADCVSAAVTYTSPSGSTTTAGGCVAPTGFPTLVSYGDETGTSATGYVAFSARVPAP